MYCPDIGPVGLTKTTWRWGSWYSDRESNRVYLEHTMEKRNQRVRRRWSIQLVERIALLEHSTRLMKLPPALGNKGL